MPPNYFTHGEITRAPTWMVDLLTKSSSYFYTEYNNKSNKCYKCYKKWIYHTIYKEARRCRRRGTASAPALPSLPASARTELSLGHTPPAPTSPRSASNIARWMELTQLGSKSIMLVNDDEPTIATNTRSAPQLSPHILVNLSY